LPSPQPGNAQVAGGQGGGVIGGQSIGIIGARGPANPTAPRVELNRDPIPVVDLAPELVEIFPGGTRRLAGGPSPIGPSTGTSYRGIRAGGTGSGALGMNLGLSIQYSLKVVELNKEGVILDVTVSDSSKAVLASKRLALNNYEEAIIELAAAGGDKRLALRFLPTISAIPAVQEYPALVQRLTLSGLLILNGKEVLSKNGIVSGEAEDLNGPRQQFFTFSSQRMGFVVMSYRPFPGATMAGYFEDKKLVFEWNGDLYEWFSLDKPFMPEGKWAAYFWQADPSAGGGGFAVGVFEANPNSEDLASRVSRWIEVSKQRMIKK
jgi:hypothetical protein